MKNQTGSGAVIACLSLLVAGAAHAACKPEAAWSHQHADATLSVESSKVKGSPSTTIKICRADDKVADAVKVVVMFQGVTGRRPFAPGTCEEHLAKWGIVESKGTKLENGDAAVVGGTTQVCLE